MRDFYIVSEEILNSIKPEILQPTVYPFPGDKETARIVFSTTIEGAINIYYDGERDYTGNVVQVYKAPSDVVPLTPSIESAPYTLLTQEVWVTEEVKPIYLGKALVTDGKKIEIPYKNFAGDELQAIRWTYSFRASDSFLNKNLSSNFPLTKLINFSPFKELLALGSKASSILSFTMSDIEGGIVESKIGARGETRLEDVVRNVCYFSTESFEKPPLRWMQIIAFEDLFEMMSNPGSSPGGTPDPVQVITDAIFKGNVRLNCNDPSFSFEGYHYIATQLDFNYQVEEERPPVKRNPEMRGTVCKHLSSCFFWIRDNISELVQRIYDVNGHLMVTKNYVPEPITIEESEFDEDLFPEYLK